MSVRKFLDENGATQLNTLLTNKFATKRDKDDGEVVHEITENGTKIYELPDGIYYCNNKAVKYKSNINYTLTGFIIVTTDGTEKFATVMEYDMITSFAMATDGSSLTSNKYLDVSRVRNDLNYSVSSNNYVLSAYQGYVLNQNKADKTEIPTTTSQLTNDSGFISSADGEVIKQLADGNIYIWTLDSGTYSLPTTGYIYYDPDDNTKRVQIGSGGLLLIDKQDNYVNKYVLYMNRIIMYGMTDTIGGMSTATVNTCQSIQNKVTSISSSSTDTQYPSAKCVYNLVGNVEAVLQTLNSGNGVA